MDDTRRNDRLRQDYRRKRRKRRKKRVLPKVIFLIAAITVMCYFGIRIIVPFFSNDLGTSTELQTINEQISNFAQTYPTNLKASSNEALLFMRRYRFANCSCFSCCFKDAYPSSNVQ